MFYINLRTNLQIHFYRLSNAERFIYSIASIKVKHRNIPYIPVEMQGKAWKKKNPHIISSAEEITNFCIFYSENLHPFSSPFLSSVETSRLENLVKCSLSMGKAVQS